MIIVQGHYKNDQNKHLACTYYYPDDFDPKIPRPGIIVNHGIGGNNLAEYVVKSMVPITENGGIGIAPNLRGADALKISTKELTSKNTQSDLDYAARAVIANKHINPNAMVNIACSWTSYNSAQNAINPNCIKFRGHVFHSLVAKPMEAFADMMTPGNMRKWRFFKYFPAEIDGNICKVPYELYRETTKIDLISGVAPNIVEPVTIIQGDRDQIGFCQTAKDFYENLRPESKMNFHILRDAPHAFVGSDLDLAIQFSEEAVLALVPELQQFRTLIMKDKQQRMPAA